MAVDWTVEVDADPDTTGQFIIGVSLLGGADVLAPTERWVDVGPVVRNLKIRRGRKDDSRPYNAGVCTVEFENDTGDFDPDNPYGHYVMGPQRLLHQGTGLRIKAEATAPVAMFTGGIDKQNVTTTGYPEATYTGIDLMARLGVLDVPFLAEPIGAGDTSNTRANWLLDQAAIPTDKRAVAASGRAVLGTTGGGKTREALQRVASGEAGRFFVDRDGLVTLTWHVSEYGKTSEVDFADTEGGTGPEYVYLETSPGSVGIINTATVHRTPPRRRNEESGQFEASDEIPDVGAVDETSVGQYGTRPVTVEAVLQDDADAESLASFLARRRAQPRTQVTTLRLDQLEFMAAADAQAILELDLGSMVTVTRHTFDGRELMWTAIVEGITVDVEPGATFVTLSTAPADTADIFGGTGWFMIGDSLLGGADVLAPF